MKTLNFKYYIGDKVYIKNIKLFGKITGIYISCNCIQYNIRYFDGVKPETCYFDLDEISREEPKEIGFK